MMSLWADGSALTAGTNTYSGKDAIRAFFAAAGPFNHNWVGLTKAFVFSADVQGGIVPTIAACRKPYHMSPGSRLTRSSALSG
jgi:hypothetical protein